MKSDPTTFPLGMSWGGLHMIAGGRGRREEETKEGWVLVLSWWNQAPVTSTDVSWESGWAGGIRNNLLLWELWPVCTLQHLLSGVTTLFAQSPGLTLISSNPLLADVQRLSLTSHTPVKIQGSALSPLPSRWSRPDVSLLYLLWPSVLICSPQTHLCRLAWYHSMSGPWCSSAQIPYVTPSCSQGRTGMSQSCCTWSHCPAGGHWLESQGHHSLWLGQGAEHCSLPVHSSFLPCIPISFLSLPIYVQEGKQSDQECPVPVKAPRWALPILKSVWPHLSTRVLLHPHSPCPHHPYAPQTLGLWRTSFLFKVHPSKRKYPEGSVPQWGWGPGRGTFQSRRA